MIAVSHAVSEAGLFLHSLVVSIKNCVIQHIAGKQASVRKHGSKFMEDPRKMEDQLHENVSVYSVPDVHFLNFSCVFPSTDVQLPSWINNARESSCFAVLGSSEFQPERSSPSKKLDIYNFSKAFT